MGGACFFAEDAKAQDAVYVNEAVTVTEYSCDNTTRNYQSWRDNWFIQLGAGITQPFVERGVGGVRSSGHNVDRKLMTLMSNVGVGHWFSPYLGLRLNALYSPMHWNNPTPAQPGNGWVDARSASLNAELMWDMCNSIGGVNSKRVFSVIPFVGLGGNYMWHVYDSDGNPAAGTNVYHGGKPRTTNWSLPVNAGIQFRLRLFKYMDFFAEVRSSFYGDNWNLCAANDAIDANVSVLGGFNINIGGRGWDTYNECGYVSQIAGLNGQVNDLRAQLLAAGQRIAELESRPQVQEKVTEYINVNSPVMATVRFHINSAEILPTEEVNVYNMAQWLKDNPEEKISVVGYADKDTGTAAYNLELSKKRADAVADALVNQYGISRDRLTVKYDGSSVQPYGENDWNRIVIFSQKM